MTTSTIENPSVSAAVGGSASVEPVVGTMRAKELHSAISNALNFAAPVSAGIPAIAAVHVEASAEQLIAVATDRFVLGATRVDYSGEPFSVSIGVDDAKTLVRIAKTLKRDERSREVSIVGVDGRVEFAFSSGESLSVRDADTEFPKWRHLLPASEERMGAVVGMGYNPLNLAKFAKVANDSHERMVVFPTATDGRPGCTAVTIGPDFVGLVMPVRAPGGVETYTVPEWVNSPQV